ncbi:MAG: hypothetical protein ABW039_04735 [Sphingobium sp.]
MDIARGLRVGQIAQLVDGSFSIAAIHAPAAHHHLVGSRDAGGQGPHLVGVDLPQHGIVVYRLQVSDAAPVRDEAKALHVKVQPVHKGPCIDDRAGRSGRTRMVVRASSSV